MHMSRKIFCLPHNWIYLLYLLTFFELCISQGYIQNFERNWKNSVCIRINNFAKSANLQNFHGSLHKKKIEIVKV